MSITEGEQTRSYERWVQSRLEETTFQHVLSVAEYMRKLATDQALDQTEAVTAALLHDSCKAMTHKDLLDHARDFGLHISVAQHARPGLLHGPVAAEVARDAFDISEAVYDAIFWHTTGRPGWNTLGMTLFLADFCEPLRTFPEAAVARQRFEEEGFMAALRYAAFEKLVHVEKKASHDPTTAAFYSWLCPEDDDEHA
jgi:predicted HD superfamily hydrolase involved in NAD metabolism